MIGAFVWCQPGKGLFRVSEIAIMGCGFVADLYMKSLTTFPDIKVIGAYDKDAERLKSFCGHWGVVPFSSSGELFDTLPDKTLILNLTNPNAHYEVSRACLTAGFHVYSEKPLATRMADAEELHALAGQQGLLLASAPCSFLGEAAQTLGTALRSGMAGTPRLIYAELDDGFIPQAPFRNWQSESGAPWPYDDEFRTGCTLEHAGYYLSWLIAIFGSVKTVVAASADLIPDKVAEGQAAPDFSVATLFFETGPVARLTCSILAPHNHQIQVVGDKGVLTVKKAWDNSAAVRFYRRFTIRRKLLEHPIGRRFRLKGQTHPKVKRTGAASMNFALGPAEMLAAIRDNRPSRMSADFALHLNEVTLAIQNAGDNTGAQKMQTRCLPVEPMPWAV